MVCGGGGQRPEIPAERDEEFAWTSNFLLCDCIVQTHCQLAGLALGAHRCPTLLVQQYVELEKVSLVAAQRSTPGKSPSSLSSAQTWANMVWASAQSAQG